MFYRLIHFLFVGLLLNVPIVVFAQNHVASPTAEQETSTSSSKAVAIQNAKRFLQVCDLQPIRGEISAEKDDVYQPALVWSLTCEGYEFDVEASTGHIINFQNYQHYNQRYHNSARVDTRRFETLEEASAEVWRLARAIGIPNHAYLSLIAEHTDEELKGHDQNPLNIAAGISWALGGGLNYPLLGFSPDNGTQPGMNFMLDSQDGQLMFFSQSIRSIVVGTNVQLTGSQAIRIAQDAYQKWYSQDQSSIARDNSPDASLPELGYISRSGLYDFINGGVPPRTDPIQWQLAWGIYFGKTSIFVDAADGAVLGGQLLGGMSSRDMQNLSSKAKKARDKDNHKLSLRHLLQTVSKIRVYHHQSSLASANISLVDLSKTSEKNIFSILKEVKYFQSQPPVFAAYDFVFTMNDNTSVNLHYDSESGLLGIGNQWCYVPDQLKRWVAHSGIK